MGEYLPGASTHDHKGRSFRGAQAVAAGIAVLLLDYTSCFSDISDGYSVMRKLFSLISESSATESYRYLDIISFFRQGNICEELIKVALTRKGPQTGYLSSFSIAYRDQITAGRRGMKTIWCICVLLTEEDLARFIRYALTTEKLTQRYIAKPSIR